MRAVIIPLFVLQVRRVARISVAPSDWDIMLRTCAVVTLGSLVVSVLFPGVSDLAAFFTLMLIACGPTSAFLPAASEPVLITFGHLYDPLMLAGIGIVAIVLIEFLNYWLFDTVLNSKRLSGLRDAKCTRRVVRWFNSQPFLTVAIAALTPIPFWMARTCAVLSHYSLPRYMCATALGRFWRIYLIAAVGSALPFTTPQIVGGAVLLVATFAVVVFARRLRRRPSPHLLTAA